MDDQQDYDVVIVGGGPVGATVSTLLRKYNQDLSVLVVEKEVFPREHVGESLLPSIMPILDEMGVWEHMEEAGFPVKLGASLTWGATADRWDLDFYPVELWRDEPRPAKFSGARRHTAFQVDRGEYDHILLKQAKAMGAEVREGVRVEEVLHTGDRIDGLRLHSGETVKGRYYVDGSGVIGTIRRALGIGRWEPTELRNIATWDYWDNAEWAVKIGVGGTRIQIRSLPYGWIWFIPVSPTRTSIGFVCPTEYYKSCGKSPEDLYLQALADQPEIASLLTQATQRKEVKSCKDWSHLADKLVGENWFLAGESAGFADPILAAGLSLAHGSARDLAYTILELERDTHDPAWLRERYNDRNRQNIRQHIRFAQYWYSANGRFTDLAEHCQSIADEAGVKLNPRQAWRWLSQGGFSTEQSGMATFGSFDIVSAKQLLERFDTQGRSPKMIIDGFNTFKLNLHNATKKTAGILMAGEIKLIDSYERGGSELKLAGYYGALFKAMNAHSDAQDMFEYLRRGLAQLGEDPDRAINFCIQALEVMVEDGWVLASVNKKRPALRVSLGGSRHLRSSEESQRAIEEAGADLTVSYKI